MKKKSPLAVLLGLGLMGACATTESESDLCNPRDPSCPSHSLIIAATGGENSMDAGVAGNATGTAGGNGGGGTANSGAGTSSNGGAGTSNNGGDAGEDAGGMSGGGAGGMSGGGAGGGGAGSGGGGAGSGGGGAGSGGGGAGSGGGGNGGTAGAPECAVASQAVDCDDTKECTNDVCSGGWCTHTNKVGACTADADSCTDDVCAADLCTHPAITPCTQDTVIIHVNRCNSYVSLDANNYLFWDNQTIGTAETFTRVTVAAGFKLKSMTNSMWVRVDNATNDKLVADQAAEANASVFVASACEVAVGGWSGISFTADNDGNKFLKTNDAAALYHLEAANGACTDSATSWEKFELCAGGTCALTGTNQYCPP